MSCPSVVMRCHSHRNVAAGSSRTARRAGVQRARKAKAALHHDDAEPEREVDEYHLVPPDAATALALRWTAPTLAQNQRH
jgi:hypothetical protein